MNTRRWDAIQLTDVTKLVKEWYDEDNKVYCKVETTFGRSLGGGFTPVIVQNVYKNGESTDYVVDSNCDDWRNGFQFTNKDDGNEYYKMLVKHGFKKVQ